MKMTDTMGAILERLIEAQETDDALPVRVGPKAFGSAMPDYIHSAQDLFVQEREDLQKTGGKNWTRMKNERRKEIERRARASKERISRMDEAFTWVLSAVPNEEHRKCLLAYAMVKARGWDWSRYISARNRKTTQENAWNRRTVYRWNEKSIQSIEEYFLKNGLPLSLRGDCPMSQIEAESTGKSITSGLYAWRSEDAKPRGNAELRQPIQSS